MYDVGFGKHAIKNFLNYHMVDSRPIMDQVYEIQMITQEITNEGMSICETLRVKCFTKKIPLS